MFCYIQMLPNPTTTDKQPVRINHHVLHSPRVEEAPYTDTPFQDKVGLGKPTENP